ncbi:uncharacterized protein PgNI_04552, partial [Pyricularia grisea]|uniref:Uncharacterized protein n=1 Tax=Pyricularia grisea TaxID=148305 RepID=A0A6P8B8T6_PYRGI
MKPYLTRRKEKEQLLTRAFAGIMARRWLFGDRKNRLSLFVRV